MARPASMWLRSCSMAFEFGPASLRVRDDIRSLFRREWDRLSRPGGTWTGSERVAIAVAARQARFEAEPSPALIPDAAVEAAARVATAPASIRRPWVERMAAALGNPKYVELVGVVSRLASVDSFHRAMGLPLEPLPDPKPGAPTGDINERARIGAAWVPMEGGASIVYALSLVPEALAAQEDMHGPMYLTYEGMAQIDFVRGLTRAQMELVASRTSAINECFY